MTTALGFSAMYEVLPLCNLLEQFSIKHDVDIDCYIIRIDWIVSDSSRYTNVIMQ